MHAQSSYKAHRSMCEEVSELLRMILSLVGDDPRIKILMCMAKEDLLSIRKIAMCIGLAPKNTVKYLEELRREGMIEIAYESPKLRLYRLTPRSKQLFSLIKLEINLRTPTEKG